MASAAPLDRPSTYGEARISAARSRMRRSSPVTGRSRDAGSFIRRYCGYFGPEHEKTMSTWKKERAFSIKSSGYTTYFGLSANALAQDADFEVKEDATKSQIKSAFVKSLKSKKMNKKILGEFVELVA